MERALIGCYPPGELLREELAARGWTDSHFAQLLGTTLSTVQKVLTAKSAITTELAAAIGEVLGTGPALWLNLEQQFQLDSMQQSRQTE